MSRGSRKIKKKTNSTVAVIGEGITESYYLLSIRNLINGTITPIAPKHSQGLLYLENKINECVEEGYDCVFCLMDMDTHVNKIKEYKTFKHKYHNKVIKAKTQDTKTTVTIIENSPCMELWFLYHFKYTTACYKSFENIEPLKPHLLKLLPEYEKQERFFKCCGGLHQYISSKKNSSFNDAITRSIQSIEYCNNGGNGSYSEMSILFRKILK